MTRIFKTGSVRVVEDESMKDKSVEQVQTLLSAQYPEIKNATIRTVTEGDHTVYEFLPKPGRKG